MVCHHANCGPWSTPGCGCAHNRAISHMLPPRSPQPSSDPPQRDPMTFPARMCRSCRRSAEGRRKTTTHSSGPNWIWWGGGPTLLTSILRGGMPLRARMFISAIHTAGIGEILAKIGQIWAGFGRILAKLDRSLATSREFGVGSAKPGLRPNLKRLLGVSGGSSSL